MKINIFQKITFLIYTSIIILICVYFVPYHGTQNYLGPMMENHESDSSYHSHILDEDFGSMSYLRFVIYLVIPGCFFYFIFWYLEKMNSLEVNLYKKKAKGELYFFFLFISINVGMILFLYVKNEYSEKVREPLNSEINLIDKSIDEVDENLSYRYRIYSIINDNYYLGFTWTEEVFYSYVDNEDGFLNSLYNFLKEKSEISISEEKFNLLMKVKTPNEILILKNKKIELGKKLEVNSEKLNRITSFDMEDLEHYIVFTFLITFVLFCIARPLFSMFNGMLKEVK